MMFPDNLTLYLLSLSICVTIIDGYVQCQHQQKQSYCYCQQQLDLLHQKKRRNTQLYLHQSTYKIIRHKHKSYNDSLQTRLCSSASTSKNEIYDDEQIKQILQRYGFGSRLIYLTNEDLLKRPMLAEMYEGKCLKLCIITGLKSPASQMTNGNYINPPLLNILAMNGDGLLQDEKVIDVGQITTCWQDMKVPTSNIDELIDIIQTNYKKAQETLRNDIFPIENSMQNLYNGRIANRSRPPSSHNNNHRALTKKQIPKIVAKLSNNNHLPTNYHHQHLEELLRNLLKVGEDRMSRLVDSNMATDYLYTEYCKDGEYDEQIIRRMVASQVLTDDAISGGRFKRRSCQFVSAQYNTEVETDTREEISEVEGVTLVNGGWTAVDPSIKAQSEGRKFAAATSLSSSKNASGSKDNKPLILTAADERIVHRLECLAMGDMWRSESDQEVEDDDDKMLELDVRSALTSMNLPLTPQGATSALIQIGIWSENSRNDNSSNMKVEPWSPEMLDAACELSQYEDRRRASLAKQCSASTKKKISNSNKKATSSLTASGVLEGRVDLSSLPCVCIDAKRATFRDDSIGIRLRSSTGRKVTKAASKWEVLIHIADISDIYFDKEGGISNSIHLLMREAAERRGQSRYDLPLGPLHLMPPVALTALSLTTNKESTPNRCVTLWAYIDERDGKLLEAGLERTIISSPRALSFSDATSLLKSSADDVPKSMTNARAVLFVAARNLALWSKRHQQLNQSAQKREKRLSTKELISKELNSVSGTRQVRDDGVDNSFQRSRGHRVVDSSLDLYAFAIGTLMKRAKQPIPRAPGTTRLGTAPLRRYIDGLAQRQALSVLCGYGRPLTVNECQEGARTAASASYNIDNLRSSKQLPTMAIKGRDTGSQRRQVSALYKLSRHLSSTGGINNQQQVKAVSTGHNNEVVILGIGATAKCKRVKGTLRSGQKVLVHVDQIDPEYGVLEVSLVD